MKYGGRGTVDSHYLSPLTSQAKWIFLIALLRSLQPTAFATIITAIVVHLYLHIRLNEGAFFGEGKLDVLDIQPSIKPLLLIIGLDAQYLIGLARVVEVVCLYQHWQVVLFYQ